MGKLKGWENHEEINFSGCGDQFYHSVRLIKRKIVPFSTLVVMGKYLRFILNATAFIFDHLA